VESLAIEVDAAPREFPHVELDRHREELGRADEEKDSAKAKAILSVLIEEIGVQSRGEVQPTYRLPLEEQPVRPMHRKVERTGIEPVTSGLQSRRSPS
jgi:hypothetical protein